MVMPTGMPAEVKQEILEILEQEQNGVNGTNTDP